MQQGLFFFKNIQQKKKYNLFSINNIHVGVLQYYLFVQSKTSTIFFKSIYNNILMNTIYKQYIINQIYELCIQQAYANKSVCK